MLTLPIKKKWFDMIVSGEKKEEYREIKPYYDSRFMNAFGFLLVGGQMVYGEAAPEEIRKPWPVLVVFRNGYSKDSPEVVCKCTLQFGYSSQRRKNARHSVIISMAQKFWGTITMLKVSQLCKERRRSR